MCWIGLVAGRVIGPFWIETSMKQDVYLNLLKDKVWPKLKRITERNLLWFQQDGATCHITNQNLSFLNEKFSGRVISNKTSVVWPPNSPDLTPPDFFFWGHCMQHVYRVQPKSIEELKSVVEDFSQAMDSQLICKVCRSARTRFEMLQLEKGGRFEHKKQAYKSICSGDH